MKFATFAISALAGSAVVVVMACASTEEVPAPSDTAATQPLPGNESKVPQTDASTTPPSQPPAKACVSKCTADSECQNSCPSQQNTIYCCDTNTGTCFGAKQTVCPQPEEDSGTPPPAY